MMKIAFALLLLVRSIGEIHATNLCIIDLGKYYRGPVDVSATGVKCMSWKRTSLHYANDDDILETYGMLGSSCRNPNEGRRTPWCYDRNDRFMLCDVPRCNDHCYQIMDKGTSYRGILDQTKSGRKCKSWEAELGKIPVQYLTSGLAKNNFCRNPKPGKHFLRPWCYTTDPKIEWEFCDLSACEGDNCYLEYENGASYRGNHTTTIGGSIGSRNVQKPDVNVAG